MLTDFLRQAVDGTHRTSTMLERLLQMQGGPALSAQQSAVVQSDSRRVYVAGGPATGKTTTLIEYAVGRASSRRGILFVRNQSERESMERRLACRATHFVTSTLSGYAVKAAAPALRQNFARLLCPEATAARFNLSRATAQRAIRTLEEYFASDDLLISERHLSRYDQIFVATVRDVSDAIDGARAVWESMVASRFAVTREAIFKIMSLGETQIPFDDILVDDAEDLSPAEIHFLRAQRHATVVMAGDACQHIGLGQTVFGGVPGEEAQLHVLTDSFRMTAEVAGLCNTLAAPGGAAHTLVGRYDPAATPSLTVSRRVLVSRWDGTLLERAASSHGYGVHWVGGCDVVTRLFAIYSLYAGLDALELPDSVSSRLVGEADNEPGIPAFSDYSMLKDFAQYTHDHQLLSLIRIVERYESDTPDLALCIFNNAVGRFDDPECTDVYATASSAKGHHWANVTIADDFDLASPADPTERAHLYLACGRAEQTLELPATVLEFAGVPGGDRPEVVIAASKQ
jgi:hypothetical protein